uniref:Protein kinase domain-containing protein n=1 Tax=Tetradesmus obliquus TaxID=3088 RepID=A0A383V2H6_TETOB|eukprot:jgi/Sobl393_1/455/SZX59768.1
MDSNASSVSVSSAQAYVDSLAAAFNSASMMSTAGYTGMSSAIPVCLPLTSGDVLEAIDSQLAPHTPAAEGLDLTEAAVAAAAAAAAAAAPTAAAPAEVHAAAAGALPSAESLDAAGIAAVAAASNPVAAVPMAPGAAAFGTMPTVVPAVAITPAAAAAAAAAALAPGAAVVPAVPVVQPAVVAAPVVPTALAAATDPASVLAANAAAMNAAASAAVANPSSMSAANAAALKAAAVNAAAAAVAADPTSMAALNAMNVAAMNAATASTTSAAAADAAAAAAVNAAAASAAAGNPASAVAANAAAAMQAAAVSAAAKQPTSMSPAEVAAVNAAVMSAAAAANPTSVAAANSPASTAALQAAAAAANPASMTAANAAALNAAAAASASPASMTAANVAAINAAAMSAAAASNPASIAGSAGITAANAAAMNAAAAAANAPNSMAALNSAANAPLLMAAGLSTATALMPTGATPAQIAAGMASVQAVPVIVSQPNSLAGTAAGSITGTAAGSSAASSAVNSELSKRFAAAGLTAGGMPVISAGMPGMSAGMASPPGGLSSSSLAAAAAAAGMGAGVVPQLPASAFAGIPGFSESQLSLASLNNLKSASVASSVLSAAPGLAQQPFSNMSTISNMSMVDPSFGSSPASAAAAAAAMAAAAAAASPMASTAASGKKVRVLLSSGGEYEELPMTSEGSNSTTGGGGGRSMRWRYVGGETRLVGLSRTQSFSAFLQQLAKATSAVWDESCRITYDLPGPDGDSGVLVDLIDDEDLDMMWEEFDSYASLRPGFRLHLYAQLGSKRGSTGGSSSTCPSGDSHVIKAPGVCRPVPAPGGPPPPTKAGPPSETTAAAAAAAAAFGNSSTSTAPGSSNSNVQLTSSEYDDLVADVVTNSSEGSTQLKLADLEAKLEIISPEDLTPVRLLGTGGFGEVYLCRWHSCDVAVKCLNPNLLVPDGGMGSISKDNVGELLKEASILGNVRHPNVVWVYGLVLPPLDAALEAVRSHLGPGQGLDAVKVATSMANRHRAEVAVSQIRPPALVTEYLASGSLRAAITRRADFLSRDSVRIKLALDAARGMDYLHSKHIVHFDLKSANLLVGMRDKTPVCKVADMGLSKQKQQTFVTGVATLRGTLPWIAPEIIHTPASVTQAVDVWSFGIVLYELWALREPYDGLNYHALLHMMSSSKEAVRPPLPGSPEFEGDAGPEPAPGWGQLITDCLATAADDRPTFRDVVSRLENMLRSNRMAKRRTASGPAAAVGTSGAQGAAAAGSLGVSHGVVN